MATKTKQSDPAPDLARAEHLIRRHRQPEVQQGIAGMESEVALQDFEEALEQADSGAKRGRPKGSPNREVVQADGELTRCHCGSTQRGPYFNRRDVEVAGVHALTGRPYTSIIIRRTQCLDCGQHRDDRHFVNQPSG